MYYGNCHGLTVNMVACFVEASFIIFKEPFVLGRKAEAMIDSPLRRMSSSHQCRILKIVWASWKSICNKQKKTSLQF